MKSLDKTGDYSWTLEYRHIAEHQVSWSRVWGDKDKPVPQQSLEDCLDYVKTVCFRSEKRPNGHVIFHPGFQARIYNTTTGEVIPCEIFT